MHKGREAMQAEFFDSAATAFEDAFMTAFNDTDRAEALQMKGIALRLGSRLTESERALSDARTIALGQNTILVARIERDLGMTILDLAIASQNEERFDEAEDWFKSSYDALKTLDSIEAGATIGFFARSLFSRGLKRDSIAMFRDSHVLVVGKNATYELNNLVWLARASAFDRWRFALRIFRLARITKDTRRAKEYIIILAGGNYLYKKVLKFYRSRQSYRR